jgi:outer membrane protein OmpA-like peptidoglycan-associated protein
VPKAIAFVCAGLAICSLQPGRAQVLTTDQNAPGAARDTSGTLAGPARGLHPSMAAHLTSPAIMDADESISALPLKVMFEPGSARLTASATRALDHLGQSLSAGPLADERVRIEGHADTRGTRDAKRDIAERRAMAVAAYLEQNFGINPNRVECTGQGAAPPSQRLVLIVALTSG